MTGREAFSATVSAPDGAVSAVPVVLAEGGAHYQATLQWLLTGIHKVSACRRPPLMACVRNSCHSQMLALHASSG